MKPIFLEFQTSNGPISVNIFHISAIIPVRNYCNILIAADPEAIKTTESYDNVKEKVAAALNAN